MKSKKEESIMLIVLGLIGTPNMLVFIVRSFRSDDVLDTIFGYIMVAMLIFFWVCIVIELIKSKRNNNKKN
jgi:tellurite resistance protein TehA-like permease